MVALLDRMAPQLGPLGSGVGGGLARPRRSPDRVPVLARVARQLLAAELPRGPAPVEGVAKDVPALAGFLDPVPGPLHHVLLLVRPPGEARRIPAPCDRKPSDIAVPPFPPGTEWIGAEPGAVERICARGPLLVHFVDVGASVERPHAPLSDAPGTSATATAG